jgi:hypothetical protein
MWRWAGLGVPDAELLAADEDPRASAHLLARRALADLPAGIAEIRLRADAGYLAGNLHARRCGAASSSRSAPSAIRPCGVLPARSAKTPGCRRSAWITRKSPPAPTARTGGPPTPPAWSGGRIPAGAVSCDPRARRRRTIPKDQLALALVGPTDHVYGYSSILTNLFILTKLDVSDSEKIVEAGRGTGTARISRHSTATPSPGPRSGMPSGDQQASPVWMRAALLAAAISAWLRELTRIDRATTAAGK